MRNVFLLLGSNLGDRPATMQAARKRISQQVGAIVSESSIYETEPWGVPDQPAFLNQVIALQTEQGPEEILQNALNIEHELGRLRHERWSARVIDIDLLYVDDLTMDSATLTLPHPRLQDRRFTLIPLNEIAPEFVHPVFQKTSRQLLEDCLDKSEVTKYS